LQKCMWLPPGLLLNISHGIWNQGARVLCHEEGMVGGHVIRFKVWGWGHSQNKGPRTGRWLSPSWHSGNVPHPRLYPWFHKEMVITNLNIPRSWGLRGGVFEGYHKPTYVHHEWGKRKKGVLCPHTGVRSLSPCQDLQELSSVCGGNVIEWIFFIHNRWVRVNQHPQMHHYGWMACG
jgi:hypothetical protein